MAPIYIQVARGALCPQRLYSAAPLRDARRHRGRPRVARQGKEPPGDVLVAEGFPGKRSVVVGGGGGVEGGGVGGVQRGRHSARGGARREAGRRVGRSGGDGGEGGVVSAQGHGSLRSESGRFYQKRYLEIFRP